MEILKKLFGNKANNPQRDFSTFFNQASKEEKTNLLQEVVRKANEDQRRLMREAKKASSYNKKGPPEVLRHGGIWLSGIIHVSSDDWFPIRSYWKLGWARPSPRWWTAGCRSTMHWGASSSPTKTGWRSRRKSSCKQPSRYPRKGWGNQDQSAWT